MRRLAIGVEHRSEIDAHLDAPGSYERNEGWVSRVRANPGLLRGIRSGALLLDSLVPRASASDEKEGHADHRERDGGHARNKTEQDDEDARHLKRLRNAE